LTVITVCALSAQTHTCIILPCCHSHRCHHLRVRVGALSARCWTGRLARAGPRAARRGQLVQPLATVASTAGERHPCLTRHRSPATADALDLQHLEGAAAVIQCVQHTFQQIAVVCLTQHGAAAGPRAWVGTEVDSGSARAGNICASVEQKLCQVECMGLLSSSMLHAGPRSAALAGTLAGTAGTTGTAATAALWLALLAPQRHFGWHCWRGSGTGWHGQAGTAVRQLAGTGMEMHGASGRCELTNVEHLDFFAGRAHLLGLSGRCGPYQCQSEEQRDAAARHLSLFLARSCRRP
jgi:hypothetical protein